ncbi:MAG: VWA domain-containing protein, partial [Betaproteobacteria bacterium]|nr:VWA domain-containing protein [Betaproteobacteria bacterium]
MQSGPILSGQASAAGFLHRLLRDRAGNTLAMIAAAILPIMAMVGGGVDMGRSYLAQSRLQQACDAGTLAARKRLGTEVAVTGIIPDDAAAVGQRFFNINYRNGSYGSTDRAFSMVLEDDLSISGEASVAVPTTIMKVFGFEKVDVSVNCVAQMNMSNTDVMFVLDTTGSMFETNPGDTSNRIDSMRSVVKNFIAQLKANSTGSHRLRFGFVPYSTNVNVGGLLKDDWVVKDWNYQSRDLIQVGTTTYTVTYNRNWTYVSGSVSEAIATSSYPATFHNGNGGSTTIDENENVIVVPASGGYYTCDTPPSGSTYSWNATLLSTTDYPLAGPPSGTQTVQKYQSLENGTRYWLSISGSTCKVMQQVFTNRVQTYERVTEPREKPILKYQYKQMPFDVSAWRSTGNGCIEERDTYEITDYDHVDFTKALDLDIDLVPTSSDATKWRPMFPGLIYARSMMWNGSGSFTTHPVTTADEYVMPQGLGLATCPTPARKLAEMSNDEVDTYLNSLQPNGQTY